MFLPSTQTSPPTRAPGMTSCMRLMQRRKVDFPQPDGPISAVTLFSSKSSVTSRIASFLPYQAETSSARTAAVATVMNPQLLDRVEFDASQDSNGDDS